MGKSPENPVSDVDSAPDVVAPPANPIITGKRVANEVVDNQVVGSKKQKIVNDDVDQAVEKIHFETETKHFEMESRENTKEDQTSSSQEHCSPKSDQNHNKENDNLAIQANKFPSAAVKNGSVDTEEIDIAPAIKSTTQDAKKASSSNESKEKDEDDNFKEEAGGKHLKITEKSVDVPPAIKSAETTENANIARNSDDPLEQNRDDNFEDHQHLETSEKSDIDVEMLDASSVKQTPQTSVTSQSMGSKTVLMDNLSFLIKEEDVKKFFKNVGEIAEVHFNMKEDYFTGHGYVEFTSAEAAQKALKHNNELLLDNPVRLDLATERGVHSTTTPHATGSKTLYLGNLSFSIEEDDVRDFFKDVGEIAEIRFAIRDDRFQGYGHVEFTTAEAAQEALKLNNEVILDRRVKLDLARRGRGVDTTSSSMEKSNQKERQAQGKTVYIRGFDYSVGFDNIRSALEKHFGKCGEILRMSIPKDYDSGTPRGVAFIEFADSNAFIQAMGLNKSEVGGNVITVEEAKKQRVVDSREGSGHGGGRGFGGAWSGASGSGGGWHRENGSGGSWHRDSGSGISWHRENGSGGGWHAGSGSGSSWHRENGSGGGWHRESGSGSASRSGSGRESGSSSSWRKESGSGGGWCRENGLSIGWSRDSGSRSGWGRENGSGSGWHRESGSSRVGRFSGSHDSRP